MSTRHGSATVVLPSDTRILIARSSDAPAALDLSAHSPNPSWWGFEDAQWEVCEIDLPHRLVSTEVFEGVPEGDLK